MVKCPLEITHTGESWCVWSFKGVYKGGPQCWVEPRASCMRASAAARRHMPTGYALTLSPINIWEVRTERVRGRARETESEREERETESYVAQTGLQLNM